MANPQSSAVAADKAMDPPPPPPSSSSSLPPSVPQGWNRCHFYIAQKKRFCRQKYAIRNDDEDGPRYCGNHEHLFYCNEATKTITSNSNDSAGSNPPESDSSEKSSSLKRRIPCPLDPSHSIQANKMAKHVLVCPKAKRIRAMEKLYYYRDSLNTGGYGGTSSTDGSATATADSLLHSTTPQITLDWAKRVALCVLHVHQELFSKSQTTNHTSSTTADISRCKDDRTTRGLVYCMSHEEIVQALPLQDYSSSSSISLKQQGDDDDDDEKTNLERAIQAYSIKSGGPKHIHQQASLLGHLRRLGAIPSPQQQQEEQPVDDTSLDKPKAPKRKRINILELGAGRGMMGLVAAGVAAAASTKAVTASTSASSSTTTRLILVERSGCRSKADRILRNHTIEAPGPINSTDMDTTTKTTSTESTIDASSSSSSSNRPMVQDYMNLQNIEWSRIQCDLAHVDMEQVLTNSKSTSSSNSSGNNDSPGKLSSCAPQQRPDEEELHVIAKHLCGVGTDLALKSLQPIRHSVSTCLLATCCHGICLWKDYVGRDYLYEVMTNNNNNTPGKEEDNYIYLSRFGEAEFELLCQWSAGTVATNWTASTNDANRKQQEQGEDDDGDDDNEHGQQAVQQLTQNKDNGVAKIVEALNLACGVQGLGRACQRLIDYGRLEYMRHVLFGSQEAPTTTVASATTAMTSSRPKTYNDDPQVQLVYYVPPEVTPQNAALMGRRQ